MGGGSPASIEPRVSFAQRDKGMRLVWNEHYRALYDRTYRVLYDAGINEELADELATQRTLAVALTSREQPRARTVMLRRSHQ